MIKVGQQVRWRTEESNLFREGVVDAVYPKGSRINSKPFCMVYADSQSEWWQWGETTTRVAVAFSNPTLIQTEKN